MSQDLKAIEAYIAPELKEFRQKLSQELKSNTPLLNRVLTYVLKSKGKQIRPMMVLLSAKATGAVTHNAYVSAIMIELLHTATLIHDDIVDDAEKRRGFFSVKALWKNKAAVLIGDFLLARGLLVSMEHQAIEALQIMSRAVQEMSEGELLQMEKARTLNMDQEVYLEVIRKKTASLFAACLACGLWSNGADKEEVELMYKAGALAGMAFQIRDDLFDLEQPTKGQKVQHGKSSGLDLRDKKYTLPLILTYKSAHGTDRSVLRSELSKQNPSQVLISELIHKYQGMERSRDQMLQYAGKSKEIIKKVLGAGNAEYLCALIDFSIERQH